MPARKRCIVVADATFARVLLADPEADRLELIEHSELENCAPDHEVEPSGDSREDPTAPGAALRARKRVNVDQEFAVAVAHHIGEIVQDWQAGDVLIAAAPGTLGMLRAIVQQALPKGVQLKALAKNYVSLSGPELAERLDFQ